MHLTSGFSLTVVRTGFGHLTLLGIDCGVVQLSSAIEVSVAMLDFSRALGVLDSLAGLYLAFVFFLMQQPSDTERPSDATTSYPSQLAGIPSFDITPYGIRAHLPIVNLAHRDVAILFVSRDDGHHLCLELEKCDSAADPTRPLYCIPYRLSGSELSPLPVFDPGKEFSQGTPEGRNRWDKFLAAPWRTIYFVHRPPQSLSKVRLRMNRDITTPFYVSPGTVAEFTQRHPGMRLVGATMFANSGRGSSAGILVFDYISMTMPKSVRPSRPELRVTHLCVTERRFESTWVDVQTWYAHG